MVSMPWSRCPPARRHPKPLEASEKQHLASPEDCGRTDPVAGQQEHPARIFQVSREVHGGSVCGKLEQPCWLSPRFWPALLSASLA